MKEHSIWGASYVNTAYVPGDVSGTNDITVTGVQWRIPLSYNESIGTVATPFIIEEIESGTYDLTPQTLENLRKSSNPDLTLLGFMGIVVKSSDPRDAQQSSNSAEVTRKIWNAAWHRQEDSLPSVA